MSEKKLIPFNLERCLAGDPIIDGEGNLAKFLYYANRADTDFPVWCIRKINTLDEDIESYSRNGWINAHNEDDTENLYMAPKTKTFYANVYMSEGELNWPYLTGLYDSKENAENQTTSGFLKTISFEIEE